METTIIDGKKIALEIQSEIAAKVAALKSKGVTPTLAVILVGDDPASASYVKGKQKALKDCGMADRTILLPKETTQEDLLKELEYLNADNCVHGILVQLPLPRHIDEKIIINKIDPKKDVDGFTPINVGNLVIGGECFLPCTPCGVLELLLRNKVNTNGAHTVIIGRSNIVGKPLALLMTSKNINSTVTICHTGTKNLCEITKTADILIVAAGHPHTVTKDMIKNGAVVIDVGVNRIPDASKKSGFRLTGDCDDLKGVAEMVTPVPGGVGPMTIAMLMKNVLQAANK